MMGRGSNLELAEGHETTVGPLGKVDGFLRTKERPARTGSATRQEARRKTEPPLDLLGVLEGLNIRIAY